MRTLIILCTVFLLALPAFAADKPDPAGKWAIDVEKSELGEAANLKDLTLTIRVKGPDLYVTQSSSDGSYDFHFNTEKKEMTNDVPGGGTMKSIYGWEGDVLAGEHTIDTPGGQMVQTDRITFSNAGKTMTLARTNKGESEAAVRIVMNRQ